MRTLPSFAQRGGLEVSPKGRDREVPPIRRDRVFSLGFAKVIPVEHQGPPRLCPFEAFSTGGLRSQSVVLLAWCKDSSSDSPHCHLVDVFDDMDGTLEVDLFVRNT